MSDVYVGPRRSGKTTRIAELLEEDRNGILVLPNRLYIERIPPLIRQRINETLVVAGSIERIQEQLRGMNRVRPLYFDNVDDLLFQTFGHPIRAISLTGRGFEPNV